MRLEFHAEFQASNQKRSKFSSCVRRNLFFISEMGLVCYFVFYLCYKNIWDCCWLLPPTLFSCSSTFRVHPMNYLQHIICMEASTWLFVGRLPMVPCDRFLSRISSAHLFRDFFGIRIGFLFSVDFLTFLLISVEISVQSISFYRYIVMTFYSFYSSFLLL